MKKCGFFGSADLPKHLQDGSPQSDSMAGWVDLAGTQKHWMVGNNAHRRRGGKEMVQISASYRAKLLLQVSTLGLRHTGSHGQTLEENKWKGLH